MTTETIVFFTDGSSRNNKGVDSEAGWAFYLPQGNILQSGHMRGTNNMAELTAVKECLKFIDQQGGQAAVDKKYVIITDSAYSVGVLTNAFKAKKNYVLINDILVQKGNKDVTIVHFMNVKERDAATRGIEIVDKEAKRRMENYQCTVPYFMRYESS